MEQSKKGFPVGLVMGKSKDEFDSFVSDWKNAKNLREDLKKYLTKELERDIMEAEQLENLSNPAFTQFNAGKRQTTRRFLSLLSQEV